MLPTTYLANIPHGCDFEGRRKKQLGQHAVLTLPFEDGLHARDDAVALFSRKAGAGGQAEAVFEEALADLAAVHLGAGKDGLEMHGLPHGAGFDVLGFKGETDLLSGDAGDLRIDGQARQPTRRFAPGGFGLHDDTGEVLEGFGVGFEVSAATRDFAGEPSELPKSDTGGDIAEAVVIPDGRMLVMGSGVTSLGRQEASLLRQLGVIGDEHAASAGGDDFVAVERMDAG